MINSIQPSSSAGQQTKSQNKKEKKVNGYGAHLASLVASGAVATAGNLCTEPFGVEIKKAGKISDEQIESFHKAAQKALELEGLDKKGVKIQYFPQSNSGEELTLLQMINPFEQMKNGENAFFSSQKLEDKDLLTGKKIKLLDANTIAMPEKELSFSVFHEIGHAINYNSSKICKILQKIRPVSMFGPFAIAFYASVTRKSKPDKNNKYTTGQKINNFIRNNAGILAFITALPMLAEEGIATLRGKKLAEKLVSPQMLKTYNKGTAMAFGTFAVTALAGALAAHTAVKVKDSIIAKKEAKRNSNKAPRYKLVDEYEVATGDTEKIKTANAN